MAAAAHSGDATERPEETPLGDLHTQQAGAASQITLKVVDSNIVSYSYPWKGNQVNTKKLVCVLLSQNPQQYCLGVAKLLFKNDTELTKQHDKFKKGTIWKFAKIKFVDEKPQWVNTPCHAVLDLRKSGTTAVLQSPGMPSHPEPPCTIADILTLKQVQRFDLMAIPTEILDQRRTGDGRPVVDVRLMDGSKKANDPEGTVASLPLTLFFASESEFAVFKGHVAKTPLVFMCLQGSKESEAVKVRTVKDQTSWQLGAGNKFQQMTQDLANICGAQAFTDVASLQQFVPQGALDFTDCAATLTVCRLLANADASTLLGDATEHLYQLNHVYVQPPHTSDTIHTNDGKRLFTQSACWDASKCSTFAFRGNAMLSLAGLQPGEQQEYERMAREGELQYPLLSSLRVRVLQKSATSSADSTAPLTDAQLNVVVVEAAAQDIEAAPNTSVTDVHALFATLPECADRLAVSRLRDLSFSAFHNLLAGDCAVDKALVLLQSTQKSVGKQIAGGFRLLTDGVSDATDTASEQKYGVVAYCTFETSPTFTFPSPPRGQQSCMALAVVSKVAAPQKAEHRADLFVEAMEKVEPSDTHAMLQMLQHMQRLTHAPQAAADEAAALSPPWEQRKCRKMSRYPTIV
jgi:hypothetical protein